MTEESQAEDAKITERPNQGSDQAAGPLDEMAMGWQASLAAMQAKFVEELEQMGSDEWLAANAPNLLPVIGQGVPTCTLAALPREDLIDASSRVEDCEVCPEDGGACVGSYRPGETVSWDGERIVYAPCAEKWRRFQILETTHRCGIPRGLVKAKPVRGWDVMTIGAWLRGVISGKSPELLILLAPGKPHALPSVCAAITRKTVENWGLGGQWAPAWVRNASALEEPILRSVRDGVDPLDCDTTRNVGLVVLHGWDSDLDKWAHRSIDKMLSRRMRGKRPHTVIATSESVTSLRRKLKQCLDLIDCAVVVEFKG